VSVVQRVKFPLTWLVRFHDTPNHFWINSQIVEHHIKPAKIINKRPNKLTNMYFLVNNQVTYTARAIQPNKPKRSLMIVDVVPPDNKDTAKIQLKNKKVEQTAKRPSAYIQFTRS
jgi:hypothetical protein